MIKNIKYAFLNNDNEVIDTAVFDINCSEQDLINSMAIFQAVKYIKSEDDVFAAVGNLWDEEKEKFYPKNIFKNMIWDFDEAKFIPNATQPENNDIESGDWIWDKEDGEWIFVPPIPAVEGTGINRWIWDKFKQEWIWSE
jgi:hypothetical protein